MTVTSSSAAAVRRNLFGVNVVVEDTMDMDMAMDHLSGGVCAMDVSPKCCHSRSSCRHHRHRASASTLRYAWRAMMRSIVGRERHHGQQQRQQGGALVADSVEC